MSLFTKFGKMLIPGRIRPRLKTYLQKSGISKFSYDFLGIFFVILFCLNLVIYILYIYPWLANTNNFLSLFLGTIVSFFIIQLLLVSLLFVLLWTYFEIRIFKRTDKIESVLPDFLGEVAINLRAGMSFDKALWNSVEPEYDILEKEIEIVAKKVMIGEDTEQALEEFAGKYDSPLLSESKDLIIVGLRSGGEISDLIEKIVENVKTASFLKKELIANIMSYIIFITLITVVISPALFALCLNLMMIIQSLGSKLASTNATTLIAFEFGKEVIKQNDFIKYSRLSIGVIAIAASMIIADLREGSWKGGVKYLFLFILIALFIYEIMLKIFGGIFGAFMI